MVPGFDPPLLCDRLERLELLERFGPLKRLEREERAILFDFAIFPAI
jgi:hypothetical protein